MTDLQTFSVPTDVARLQAAASKDPSRYNLRGVYFDQARRLAVATNGHVLAARPCECDDAPWGKVVVFGGLKKTKNLLYTFRVEASGTAVETTGCGVVEVHSDIMLPDYGLVITGVPETEHTICLDGNYLKLIADAIGLKVEGQVPLRFSFNVMNNTAPVSITDGHGGSIAILMPMVDRLETSPAAIAHERYHGKK